MNFHYTDNLNTILSKSKAVPVYTTKGEVQLHSVLTLELWGEWSATAGK